MRTLPTALLLVATSIGLLATAACGDDPSSLTGAGGSRTSSSSGNAASSSSSSGGDGASSSSSSSSGSPTPTSTSTPTPTPTCKPGLTSVALALTPNPSGPVRATALADGGTLVAWAGGGQIHVSHVDASGTKVGSDRMVAGVTVHGIAAMTGAVALLVGRAPDVMSLVKVGDGGDVQLDKQLTGNDDHNTVGSEWFSFEPEFFNQAGRMVWTGTKLVVYFPIYRHWPDGISHTGDTLRLFDANGNPAVGDHWDWGCSHSLDVRLNADGSKPVCLSDCYPQKAIMISRNAMVSSEPSGSCTGFSDAKLGGLVTVGTSNWLTFASREGRTARDLALVKLGDTTKHYLTQGAGDVESPHLAAFGTGMLAGWSVGKVSHVQQLDATGTLVGTAEDVSTLPFIEGDDFLSWAGGDAGWLVSGSGYRLARYGACK